MEKEVENFAVKVTELNVVMEGLEAANQVALDALILAMLSTNPQVIGPMRGLIAKLEREVVGSVAEAGERALISYSNRIAQVYGLIDQAEEAVLKSAAKASETAAG